VSLVLFKKCTEYGIMGWIICLGHDLFLRKLVFGLLEKKRFWAKRFSLIRPKVINNIAGPFFSKLAHFSINNKSNSSTNNYIPHDLTIMSKLVIE